MELERNLRVAAQILFRRPAANKNAFAGMIADDLFVVGRNDQYRAENVSVSKRKRSGRCTMTAS